MLANRQPKNDVRGTLIMTDREAHLRALGVHVSTGSVEVSQGSLTGDLASLSGYGAFTPITVRPYSMPRHAELERDQLRD